MTATLTGPVLYQGDTAARHARRNAGLTHNGNALVMPERAVWRRDQIADAMPAAWLSAYDTAYAAECDAAAVRLANARAWAAELAVLDADLDTHHTSR